MPVTQVMAEDSKVYPLAANELSSIELGKAVFMFMPPTGTSNIAWSFQHDNSNIAWLDDTYKSNYDATGNTRTGLMRINVDGVSPTILKKKKFELAWSVVFRSTANPNFGVQTIELAPGISNGNDECFGSTTENCTFNPLRSLAHANIKVEVLCKSVETTGLILSADGKKPIKAKWVTSGGSGGENSLIELLVENVEENICQ